MAERQALGDPVRVRGINLFARAQTAAALGVLAREQMAFAGAHAHDLAGAGDFEPFAHRLLCFNALAN